MRLPLTRAFFKKTRHSIPTLPTAWSLMSAGISACETTGTLGRKRDTNCATCGRARGEVSTTGCPSAATALSTALLMLVTRCWADVGLSERYVPPYVWRMDSCMARSACGSSVMTDSEPSASMYGLTMLLASFSRTYSVSTSAFLVWVP